MVLYDLHARLLFLLPLRLCCGFYLATAGFGKVESGWLTQPLFLKKVEAALEAGTAYHFYVPALHQVLQHGRAASVTIALVELLCGVALCCGLLSRVSAFLGLLIVGNYLLMAGDVGHSVLLPLLSALLTLSLCPSGRVLGLDAVLASRTDE